MIATLLLRTWRRKIGASFFHRRACPFFKFSHTEPLDLHKPVILRKELQPDFAAAHRRENELKEPHSRKS